ncbi:alpha/beta hydrolase family protein [Nonomuraea typhae]|uniref:Alpha/beta hydrolase family protein n=1 Tax=Nonomuraea typhae TaxID=2603600 RepID=A0ABW7Z2P0_9ACTN
MPHIALTAAAFGVLATLTVPTASTTAAGLTASSRTDAGTAGPQTLTLPAPTGAKPVGTRHLRLVDRSRRDPLVRSRPYRELMVSLWYPAAPSTRPYAPHMAPRAAADWDEHSAPGMGVKKGLVDWAATRTHARQDAPVERGAGKLPVVLFEPGDGGPRTLGTVLVEELASRGYAVLTIDHTYEADQVEFPGGRVERAVPLPDKLTPRVIEKLLRQHHKARVADVGYILNQLPTLSGREMHGMLDLSRIGILGQSIGGSVAAQMAHDDARVDAAANLDGSYVGPVARTGVAKPFLQLAAESHTQAGDPSWKSFWARSTGWKKEVRLPGAAHGSFTDLQALLPQVKGAPSQDLIGTIDPQRSIALQRAAITDFFDRHLKP